MNKVKSVEGIENAYIKRILGNIIGKDPMKVLGESPKRVAKATKGLSRKQMHKQPEKGKWSIGQILAHLCDAEIAISYRLRMGIAQSGSMFQAYDENQWAENLKYEKTDPAKKVKEYASLRESNIALLKSLSTEELNRFGIHEERGKETVERVAQMLAGHDVNHVRRIEEIRKLLSKGSRG